MTHAEISANLRGAGKDAHDGIVDGLLLGAEHILGVSRTRVPHEDGPLERSGAASVDATRERAAVSYDTPYAVAQHENLTYTHDAGRQAKYLESAVNQERGTAARLIRDAVARRLGT